MKPRPTMESSVVLLSLALKEDQDNFGVLLQCEVRSTTGDQRDREQYDRSSF
jgi:hypothetical protein